MSDTRDSGMNGFVVGVATIVIVFFLLKGLNLLVPKIFPQMANGFSLRLICVLAICANIIPFQIFLKQGRALAVRGLMSSTFVGIAAWIIYFKIGDWMG